MPPLEGVRVVDLSRAQMGPYAGVLLADMGAEVLKIEPPGDGEYSRNAFTFWYPPGEISAYTLANNRGKKSVTVDLHQAEGIAIVLKLVAQSDVLIQNYRPGLIDRIGLGYEKVSAVNPRIIYLSASGWGEHGPKADRPLYDLVGVAASGLTAMTGPLDGPPAPIGAAVGDQVGAMMSTYGVLAALYARERTGLGQQVEVSQIGALLALQSWEVTHFLLTGKLPPKAGRGLGLLPGPWLIFACNNDRWIAVAGVIDDRWPGFCRVMGIEHLQFDPRFVGAVERARNKDHLVPILDEIFRTKTDREWLALLEAEDQICGPVNTYADVVDDPQVKANDLIVSATHPSGRDVRMVGLPVKLSNTPGVIRGTDPVIGQHTEEILVDLLGYTWDEINDYRDRGII